MKKTLIGNHKSWPWGSLYTRYKKSCSLDKLKVYFPHQISWGARITPKSLKLKISSKVRGILLIYNPRNCIKIPKIEPKHLPKSTKHFAKKKVLQGFWNPKIYPWASINRYVFKIIEKSHDNIVYITYHILHACRHDILIKYKTYFHFIKVRRFKALYYFILDAGRNLQRKRIVLSADKIHAVLLQWKTLGFAPSKCGFGSMPLYVLI